MRLIALDAAPGVPSAALLDGETLVARWRGAPRAGPRSVLDAVRRMLAETGLGLADFDAVACGRGPGAFTGVRLALALAQGLALGSGRPLVTVSDLAALAWRAARAHGWLRVLACMDARQGEVYWGAYECRQDTAVAVIAEEVAPPERVAVPAGGWPVAGSGADALTRARFLSGTRDSSLVPDAEAVGRLAEPMIAAGLGGRPQEAAPVYLRTRVAAESRGRHNYSVT